MGTNSILKVICTYLGTCLSANSEEEKKKYKKSYFTTETSNVIGQGLIEQLCSLENVGISYPELDCELTYNEQKADEILNMNSIVNPIKSVQCQPKLVNSS